MDCRELSSQIEDYCDDSVSPQTYLKISKHLKECPTCQQLYQLTRLENEVLRDTSDIPPLSPDFTSRVMESIGSVRRRPGIFYNRKFRYSGIAAAAVVVLILFVPQLLKNPSAVNVADNSGYGNDSMAPLVVSTPANGRTTELLAEKQGSQDMAAAPRSGDEAETPSTSIMLDAPAETPSLPSVLGTKLNSAADAIPEEDVPIQKSLAYQPEQPEVLMLRTSDPSIMSPMATRNGSAEVVENIEPVLTPVNIPPHLQLVEVDISSSSRTVYDYASLDGLAKVQITVDPYIEPEVQMQALEKASTEGINSLSRWVKLGNKMITVTYSGNVSVEELTNLANTVRFQ